MFSSKKVKQKIYVKYLHQHQQLKMITRLFKETINSWDGCLICRLILEKVPLTNKNPNKSDKIPNQIKK